MTPHFFVPPQHTSQYVCASYPKNSLKYMYIGYFMIRSTIPLLNSVKILTLHNFKNFESISILSVYQPGARPTNTRGMALDVSYYKNDRVQFTKLLFQ